MTNYRCEECGEIFEKQVNCITHHLQSGHQKFKLLGTDIGINIKSK